MVPQWHRTGTKQTHSHVSQGRTQLSVCDTEAELAPKNVQLSKITAPLIPLLTDTQERHWGKILTPPPPKKNFLVPYYPNDKHTATQVCEYSSKFYSNFILMTKDRLSMIWQKIKVLLSHKKQTKNKQIQCVTRLEIKKMHRMRPPRRLQLCYCMMKQDQRSLSSNYDKQCGTYRFPKTTE